MNITKQSIAKVKAQARAAARAADQEKTGRIQAMVERNRIEGEEQRRNHIPGTIGGTFEVYQMLRSSYGISRAGTEWLLYESPYRPPEVQGVDLEIYGIPGLVHFSTAWNDQQIRAAACTFISECRQDSPTLWSHPKVKGRFKLRPPMVY